MVENDIYKNKERYESFMNSLDDLAKKPERPKKIYYCKNSANIVYFKTMSKIFDRKDNSYIRRLRFYRTLLIMSYCTEKNLADLERDDINEIVAYSRTINKSIQSKETFIKDVKYGWRMLFPEKDEKGRIDDTIYPYAVRHLSGKIEKSKQKLIKEKEEEENEVYLAEKEKERKVQERHNAIEREIDELFEFKKAKNSVKALPLDKTYSEDIMRDAESKMEHYIFAKNRLIRIRNEAIEYYQSNDINTKPRIHRDEEPIYAKVREEIKEGKLNLKTIALNDEMDDSEPKLKGEFYRAKELSEEAKKRAIKQGFTHIRGIELDGLLSGGGFYIKKESNESDYHFCMKNLFKELNNKMKIEYGLEGKRVDVAFISPNLRLGIEIETNKNKDSQLAAKIPWLNKNFDKWIFVCSRDAIKRYEKLVDNNKSFCFTTKKAKERVLELIQLSCSYKQ